MYIHIHTYITLTCTYTHIHDNTHEGTGLQGTTSMKQFKQGFVMDQLPWQRALDLHDNHQYISCTNYLWQVKNTIKKGG